METWGIILVFAAAIIIGFAAQFLAQRRLGVEGLADAAGAVVGAVVASEYLGRLSDWGTTWYGVRIFPAVIGAVVVALIVEAVIYYLERGARTPSAA